MPTGVLLSQKSAPPKNNLLTGNKKAKKMDESTFKAPQLTLNHRNL